MAFSSLVVSQRKISWQGSWMSKQIESIYLSGHKLNLTTNWQQLYSTAWFFRYLPRTNTHTWAWKLLVLTPLTMSTIPPPTSRHKPPAHNGDDNQALPPRNVLTMRCFPILNDTIFSQCFDKTLTSTFWTMFEKKIQNIMLAMNISDVFQTIN